MRVIIANIIALIGSILMVYAGTIKDKKKMLDVITVQIALFGIVDLILGAYIGTAINIVSIIRNILYYKGKLHRKEKVLLLVISIVLSITVNTLGFIGLFPLFATSIYIIFMDYKGVISFKILTIIAATLWCIYEFSIMSYVSSLFDFFSIISNTVAIIQIISVSKKTNIKYKKNIQD